MENNKNIKHEKGIDLSKQTPIQSMQIINFNEAYVAPKVTYNKRMEMLEWGNKNNYPKYLLDLYNNYGSSTHKSIINKKTKLIAGKGFEDVLSPELKDFIFANQLEAEVKKAALDYEIFNSYAFEVVWNNDGSGFASVQHMPIHKLRMGVKCKEANYPYVWFSNDWSNYRKDEYKPEAIRLFNPYIKQGKMIILHIEYNPESEVYPIPTYSTSMNYIELGYEISKFHLNQAKQGYSPSFMLNFATGIPTEEEQKENGMQFKKNYEGTENAGKIIITYSEGIDQKPELTKIDLNDSDKRFIMLMQTIKDEIVTGAEIPPQMLITVAGSLGSSDERKELLAEFQDYYVSPRQDTLESTLKLITYYSGFQEELKLKKYNTL